LGSAVDPTSTKRVGTKVEGWRHSSWYKEQSFIQRLAISMVSYEPAKSLIEFSLGVRESVEVSDLAQAGNIIPYFLL
jgi:hypothetical protein